MIYEVLSNQFRLFGREVFRICDISRQFELINLWIILLTLVLHPS